MEFVLFMVLFVAVGLLWDRTGTLQRRVDQLESDAKLQRVAPAAAVQGAMPSDEQPVSAPVPVPPAAVVAPARGNAWNPPHPLPEHQLAAQPHIRRPPAPEPAADSLLVRLVREYFTGGNLVVRVGVIVLFFGVAFLLKYAAEHTQLSIQMRLNGVALGAAGLFALGWKLRARRRGFALALQGGAIGVMYLTLFAALRLYALLPPGTTFGLMAALGVISCLLAIRQDSLALAMLGASGGFLAPVLASTGQGSHVVLFSYYALLDVFIVAQAWFKAWRPLNVLAFVFTFGVGIAWGVLRYVPENFATTEPFLLFFFLAFIAIAILFAFRAAPQLTHYVDGTLVFGTPVVAMAMQMELVRDFHHGRAWSALGAGAIYLLLATWLHRGQRDTVRLLKESFLALGMAFLTLAVPLWLDDTWTAVTWALEGAALWWTGLRQQRRLSAASGLLLQLAAAVAYVLQDDTPAAVIPVANAHCVGALLLCMAGLLSAHVALRPHPILKAFGAMPSHLLLVWGLGWWFYACGGEVQEFVPSVWRAGAFLSLSALTALICGALVRPLSWPALRVPALLLLPALIAATAVWNMQQLHPFSQGGWLAWPLAFGVLYLNLRWHEASLPGRMAAVLHGLTVWLLGLVVSWETGWQVQQIAAPGTAWTAASWAIAPVALLAMLGGNVATIWWPARRYLHEFRTWIAAGFAAVLLAWSLWFNWTSDGAAAPWGYLPLLNPLDFMTGLALLVAARWLAMVWRAGDALFPRQEQRLAIAALFATAFFWLNAVLLRTLHYWNAIPYRFDALVADTSVQAALSIFWTLLALGAMLWANRSSLRVVWFGGAGLMAVVVAKLFLVDLVRVGTLPRIVSFLVVGGLMLVIGYFSPLPPSRREAASS